MEIVSHYSVYNRQDTVVTPSAGSSHLKRAVTRESMKQRTSTGKSFSFLASEIANPSISRPLADADNDGVANVLEYLLATNPRNPSSNRPLGISSVGVAGQRQLEITLTLKNQVTGFTAVIDSSETLEAWNLPGQQLTLWTTTENDDGTTTLVYRSDELNDLPGTKNLFFRVRAVQTP